MNRRQFFKTVAATAAGVTAAVVVPSVGKEPTQEDNLVGQWPDGSVVIIPVGHLRATHGWTKTELIENLPIHRSKE